MCDLMSYVNGHILDARLTVFLRSRGRLIVGHRGDHRRRRRGNRDEGGGST